jgi:hypothetical protein
LQQRAVHLALVFGVFLAIAETLRNWGDWQWWPFWLVDYVAAGLLVAGGISTLRRTRRGPRLLAGAWGFTTAMFYMSFWSHVADSDQPADGNLEQTPLTLIIGILLGIALVGFALSLASGDRVPPSRASGGR